jgi:hypothetical protein
MGVNILQIFKGSFVLKKSPSSDMQWVCLVLGDKTIGYFLVLWPQFIFPLGHVFSFKYWNALRLGFLCSLFTGNGSIEFPFGKLLNVNDIMGSNYMNQGTAYSYLSTNQLGLVPLSPTINAFSIIRYRFLNIPIN